MRSLASPSPSDFRPTQSWFRETKAIAESVHALPAYPLEFRRSVAVRNHDARYKPAETDIIYVSRYAATPTLSFFHEMGHYIDRRGLASPHLARYVMEDFRNPEYRSLFEAMIHSSAVQELALWRRRATGKSLDHVHYLLSSAELWARAYSQYITAKTQNPAAMQELRDSQTAIAGLAGLSQPAGRRRIYALHLP